MLTQEQIQNLKPGDPIVVQGIFSEVYADGNIVMQIVQKYKDKIEHDFRFFDPYSVSLPSEHGTSLSRRSSVGAETEVPTTTRLFKKDDVVTPRIYLGRKDKGLEMGEKYIVTADEIAGDMVAIKHHFTLRPDIVQTCFLELVTPVEEIPTYRVGDFATNGELCVWKVQGGKTEKVCSFNVNTHPNAQAAAEAERDRLNAEWRKEHNND